MEAGNIGRAVIAIGFSLALALPEALAQSPAAEFNPPTQTVSMWRIIADGIEWPAFLILFGSLAAIALIIDHFVTIRRTTIAPPIQVKKARQLIEQRKFRACLDALRKHPTFFGATLSAAIHHARHGFDAMQTAANEKSNELAGRMFRKVEYLNILGNLGPLMGLLGTVYGMIKAFAALSQGGGEAGADAGGLANGISLALVNTLLGLLLAIVGLGFFGWCRNRVDNLTIQATVQVLDLLEYFRPVGGSPPAPKAVPPMPLNPVSAIAPANPPARSP
jgi:biopolymer transport protein ExbB